ncbi:hypothetical protein C3B51_04010 [Pseudoalteromonas rubra]|uniref:Penicillin acylase family protein n=2 Tax=Pseudoalteromonas rubra TaxID=43658 RepID=A0A4Q7ELW3_9GAMM|nr:hypothetical protein C3B51_04010 [Pseudoalteromonas rubra]
MMATVKFSLFGLFTLALLLCLGYWYLIDQMPSLSGNMMVKGISANVSVQRDNDGAVLIKAQNREDVAFGTGYVHAQDRFFQMDLARRQSGGELAELLGSSMLEHDRKARQHLFRARARIAYNHLPDEQKALLIAYANGVNAAISQQQAHAPEYLLAPGKQQKWLPEDSLMVIYGMYMALQEGSIERERFFVSLRKLVPQQTVCFLLSEQTQWDSTLDGSQRENCPIPEAHSVVGKAALALQGNEALGKGMPGTNIWGVSSDLSASGGALLANDPHMNLFMPGVWYRAQFEFFQNGKAATLAGFTIPGIPVMGIGKNQHIAWGFSNNIGKMFDYIHVELKDQHYLTEQGWQALEPSYQVIVNANGEDEHLTVQMTKWGPLVERDAEQGLVLRWTAYQPDAVSMGLLSVEQATTVEQGVALAGQIGLPSLNLFLIDKAGSVGWSVTGPVFDREGANRVGGRPWQEADISWRHRLTELPHRVQHSEGKLWNANNRPLGDEFIEKIGDGGFVEGVRGAILKDKLSGQDQFSRTDFEQWQMDSTDRLHLFWRDLLLTVLAEQGSASDPAYQALQTMLREWDEKADADSAAMRFLAAFRYEVSVAFLQAWLAPDAQIDMNYHFLTVNNRWDNVLRRVLTEQPAHLLPADYASWNDFLHTKATELNTYYLSSFGAYENATWGDRNRLEMFHPFGFINGVFSYLLDAPLTPQSGNVFTLDAHVFGYGAAVRVVFDMQGESTFNLPGGQSGHFLSTFYRHGHDNWLQGKYQPLAVTDTQYELNLVRVSEK